MPQKDKEQTEREKKRVRKMGLKIGYIHQNILE